MEEQIVNTINLHNIMELKKNKQANIPYYATVDTAAGVLTDYDSFPYGRWFRGEYQNNEPIVAEREAGWRMRNDACYKSFCNLEKIHHYPQHCFETSCSTVYPCMTSFDSDFAGSDKRKNILNRECIIAYR